MTAAGLVVGWRIHTDVPHAAAGFALLLLAAGLRTLFGNPTATPHDAAWPLQHPVASSFMWCAPLLAVTVPLAIAAYRRRTEG